MEPTVTNVDTQAVLQVIGWSAVILLAIVGLVAGLIAAVVTGGSKAKFILGGIVGAVALPFVLALLGVTAIIGTGLLVILVIGVVGAAILVALIGAIAGKRDRRNQPVDRRF
ncbi:GlsB/YeaQ/YmgE family stress response membrane protein [Loktanella fryxellensis]|nr:GlsB/YeaQ/YmgE family stress response membrane protein [Loktanella fryxellensis]